MVDTDSYQSLIHFPFVATAPDGVHVIEKGTPIVQVIPFKRDTTMLAAEIRSETAAEAGLRTKIMRNTQPGKAGTASWLAPNAEVSGTSRGTRRAACSSIDFERFGEGRFTICAETATPQGLWACRVHCNL